MADGADRSLVLIGRVVKAHGIRGEVVVVRLSDVPGRFDEGTVVRLAGRPRTIVASRPHQGRLLVRFDGVGDRTAAELLRGADVHGEPVPLDDAETYFAHELVGLSVLGPHGEPLGEVIALLELPAAAGYDLLEVRRADGGTWLLPAVDDYVEVEDDGAGATAVRVTDPPAGLLDGATLEPRTEQPASDPPERP